MPQQNTNASNDSAATLKELLQHGSTETSDQIHKAKKSDTDNNEDNDDQYDEAYMKKNMKRFMKDNPAYMKGTNSMQKAQQQVNTEYDQVMSEGDFTAEATLIDGTEMFKAFQDFSQNLLKAFDDINDRLDAIESGVGFSNEVAAASGEVLIKASETLDTVVATPNPVKSQIVPIQPMHKAQNQEDKTNEASEIIQKAMNFGIGNVKGALLKAAVENNDNDAGRVVTLVESCHGDMRRLSPQALAKVASVLPDQS